MRVAGKIIAGIVIFMVVAALVALLSAETLLNGYVKERILHGVNNRKGTSLSLGTFQYNILANRVSCDNIRLRSPAVTVIVPAWRLARCPVPTSTGSGYSSRTGFPAGIWWWRGCRGI